MAAPSSPPGEDYNGLFEIRGPQIGPLADLAISPDGHLILLATSNSLLLVDTRSGAPSVLVKTGSTHEITSLAWLNKRRCFVGCKNGHLYVVHFGASVLFNSPIASISYAFQDIQNSIRVMRWDMVHKLLAIGYEHGVSIWQSSSKTWRLVDRITIQHKGLPGVHTLQFFGPHNRYLFVGGGFGYATWVAPGKVTFVTRNNNFHHIGNSALSPDGKFLAATTFNGSLHVWPIAGARLCPDNSTYNVETGADYRHINPHLPVAITSSGLTVVGTQAGQVAFVRMNCLAVDDFYHSTNWAAHDDRLYVAYIGPLGAIVIVGYTDKEQAQRDFRKMRLSRYGLDIFESLLSPQVPSTVSIDIGLIPKVTTTNVPMQTGRIGFDNPTSYSRSRLFLVVIFTLWLTVALWFKPEYTELWMSFNTHLTCIINHFILPSFVLRFGLDLD
ncbi:hypothetical protein FRC06_011156 [Ceratobasidium sp. 370]|nr:hypothetical protein FRC06_011156 [Ceratobasidium sp. 370]